MIIIIEEKRFDTKQITQLYPAALIKTGYGDETTQASLEWLDTEAKGRVEVVAYGIFVHLGEEEKHQFLYETREQMDAAAREIAEQIRSVSV